MSPSNPVNSQEPTVVNEWNYVPVIGFFTERKAIKIQLNKLSEETLQQPNCNKIPALIERIETISNLYKEGQARSYFTVALTIVCIMAGFYPAAACCIAFASNVAAFYVHEVIRDLQVMNDDLKKGNIPPDILFRAGGNRRDYHSRYFKLAGIDC